MLPQKMKNIYIMLYICGTKSSSDLSNNEMQMQKENK